MKNFLVYFSLILFLSASCTLAGQVVINEFSASNTSGPLDFVGEYEDWIELYNAGAAAADVSGYYLSDKASDPTKWSIPAGTLINAGDYLLIFASGRNQAAAGELHTNFKLTQTRGDEVVSLADPSGVVTDIILLDANATTAENHSYGRSADGAASWTVFDIPTPQGPNTNPSNGYAGKPTFSVAAGYYNTPQNVTITTTEPGGQIRYTTDGSLPTAASTLYSGPVSIGSTTVLRARTFSANPDRLAGFTESNTYFLGGDVHNVKVISIAGEEVDDLLNGNQIAPVGSFELFNAGQSALLDEAVGEFNEHGNDSWAYPQRGIDYITRDQYGYTYAVKNEIFTDTPRDEFQRLILKAAASDNYPFEGGGAHIRDAYVHTLSKKAELELDERSYEPCILYVNGQYWGVYEIREKVDDADYTDYYYNQDENNLYFIQTWGGTWVAYGGNNAIDDYNDIRTFILDNDMTIEANYLIAEDRINFNSLIDYVLLNSFIVNADWLIWNTAWWRGLNPDGDKKKWRFALWDMDASFNHYVNFTGIPDQGPTADPCDVQLPQLDDPEGHLDIFNALMENQQFADKYVNRYAYLLNTYFSCDYMVNFLENMVATITPEMGRHCAKWGGTVPEWQSNVQNIRDFILARCADEIDEGIVDCYNVDMPTSLTLNINIPGAGEIEFNGIDESFFPITYEYFGGVNMTIQAEPAGGYVFDYWLITDENGVETIVHEDSTSFLFQGNMNVEAFFMLPPASFSVTLIPGNAGNVVVDGITNVTDFWTGSSVPGQSIHLEAQNTGGLLLFHNWASLHGTLISDPLSPEIDILPLDGDTIIAQYFQGYLVHINVDPSGSGTVLYNGQLISAFPFSDTLFINEPIDISIIPGAGYSFQNWEITGASPGNLTNANLQFLTGPSDIDIIAHLSTDAEVTFSVNDAAYGSILLNGSSPGALPHTETFAAGTTITLEAYAQEGYVFDHWQADNNILLPDSLSASITVEINASASIEAIFVPEQYEITLTYDPAMGSVIVNGVADSDGSVTITLLYGEEIDITALPLDGNEFIQWQNNGFDVTGNVQNPLLQIIANGSGTLNAIFQILPDECSFVFPSAFTPNGDGINDFFNPVAINCEINSYRMEVYDRWGKKVFATTDLNSGWDGRSGAVGAGIGSYAYVASCNIFEEGKWVSHSYKGNISLLK